MSNLGRVLVAGHRGLVGSALVRRMPRDGVSDVVTCSRAEVDLTDLSATRSFFEQVRPETVFLAAARVGGIRANSDFPADFIRENLLIQSNVIDTAYRAGCRKLIFLGSSCIYPRMAKQPIEESALLTGSLEPTNQAYAVAKSAGIEMCNAYRKQYGFDAVTVMPTNLYGPGDNFDPRSAHVIPALMSRLTAAAREGADCVTVWGSGEPRREFLFVDDLADALFFIARHYSSAEPINVGVGDDLTIRELAELIAEVVDYQGRLQFDRGQPDGTPRKLLDCSRLRSLGWAPTVDLRSGLERTWSWFRNL